MNRRHATRQCCCSEARCYLHRRSGWRPTSGPLTIWDTDAGPHADLTSFQTLTDTAWQFLRASELDLFEHMLSASLPRLAAPVYQASPQHLIAAGLASLQSAHARVQPAGP